MGREKIILGLIIILVLAGLVWYFDQNKIVIDQAASILGMDQGEEPSQKGEPVGEPALVEESTSANKPATDESKSAETREEFFLGDPAAPVTIIEYSSHLCGHCLDFHEGTLPLIVNNYIKTGKVKLIPRLLSPSELSEAVLCANEQGYFEEFNEYLFEHISELKSIDELKSIAQSLGLDQGDFNQCFDSGRYKEKALEWYNQAKEAGVEGTPTFFVNDQKIVGNQLYSIFEEAIEQELTQ